MAKSNLLFYRAKLKHGAKCNINLAIKFKPKPSEFKLHLQIGQSSKYLYIKQRKMTALQRISLNTIDAIHLIQVQDILYCKCKNSYTTFYLSNHEPIVVSYSMKEVQKQLSDSGFFRSHQSYLVNIEHVIEVDKTKNYTLRLSDNSEIPTATRKRKEIMQILLEN